MKEKLDNGVVISEIYMTKSDHFWTGPEIAINRFTVYQCCHEKLLVPQMMCNLGTVYQKE